MAKQKLQNITPFGLRLQPELKATLDRLAHASSRSLNAEITKRLERSLEPQIPDASTLTTGQLIDELIKRLGADSVKVHIDVK